MSADDGLSDILANPSNAKRVKLMNDQLAAIDALVQATGYPLPADIEENLNILNQFDFRIVTDDAQWKDWFEMSGYTIMRLQGKSEAAAANIAPGGSTDSGMPWEWLLAAGIAAFFLFRG